MVLAFQTSAQWTNWTGNFVDVSVASSDLIVAVDATNAGSGNLMKFNTTLNQWAYYTTEMGSLANITNASIAQDGTIWVRRNIASPANNLGYIPTGSGFITEATGNLNNISVRNNCQAIGYYAANVNNLFTTNCANVFSVMAINAVTTHCAIANDGTILALNATFVPIVSVGGASFTPAITDFGFTASYVAVGDANKFLAVSNGNLYFKSGNAWVQDITAPADVVRASVASDGTIAIVTSGSDNLYFNTWDAIYCQTPPAPIAVQSGDYSMCSGTSIEIAVQGDYDVEWYSAMVGGVLLGTGNPYTYTAAAGASGGNYIAAMNVNGACKSPRTAVIINVNAAPTIFHSADVSTCPSVETVLTAFTDAGTEVFWNTDENTNEITVSPNETTTYSVSSTYNDCTTIEYVTVNVSENPVLTITGADSYCGPTGNIAQLLYLAASGGVSGSYVWSDGSTGDALNTLPTETTTYTVSSELAPNCVAQGSWTVEYLAPSFNSLSANNCSGDGLGVTFNDITYYNTGIYSIYAGSNIIGCDSVILLNVMIVSPMLIEESGVLYSANSGLQYQWVDCATGAEIEGATSSSYTPTETGFYAVYAGNDNCTLVSECYEMTVGVDELNRVSVGVYPNPANGRVTLSNVRAGGVVEIADASGRIVLRPQINSSQQTIDVSALSGGIYFVRELGSKAIPTKLFIGE